jgi:hypothetical protein
LQEVRGTGEKEASRSSEHVHIAFDRQSELRRSLNFINGNSVRQLIDESLGITQSQVEVIPIIQAQVTPI